MEQVFLMEEKADVILMQLKKIELKLLMTSDLMLSYMIVILIYY